MKAARLDELELDGLEKADQLLDRAKHDVAKYMSMTARNVDPSSLGPDETQHLMEDLLKTDGRLAAWELWSPLGRELRELAFNDPELMTIESNMVELEALVSKVGEERVGPEALVQATVAVADRITRLRRALGRRLMEVQG